MSTVHERNKARLRKRLAPITAYKLGAGCVDCGYNRCAYVLHFDHIDPSTKLAELGWVETKKLTSDAKAQAFLKHVMKFCEVRCANCHGERTWREKHFVKQ